MAILRVCGYHCPKAYLVCYNKKSYYIGGSPYHIGADQSEEGRVIFVFKIT